ncbi:MAG: zinc dependent phospholipase C family protein [Bacteroidetes bacterium]|nr:zinc dependent phospholipase C family protein [Rhodothermia bacterium]MCS7155136.1 zinc dependent phospholipase C family protein [Bacteroidota bacterium]MCX7907355.1 zinc dependent phospholipase C family protein [Bacteroidota bacterium]MDW8137918.1 zinc dependent phospholipase C family protein [Bacteroidota bacterium]MDW8286231.1 zinc dependent phospholipase C family protein [Bacteroidota bacterium]
MKRVCVLVLIVGLIGVPAGVLSWGQWAHRQIHGHAVDRLPQPLRAFYAKHRAWLIEHALDPDLRRRQDPEEAPRHFIDLERYGQYPFPELPRRYEEAALRYTADTLSRYGLAPWTIIALTERLTEAMRRRDTAQILQFSADLGHYISDVHVPLHTTLNYDGQLSGQEGIHARWESELPERFGSGYRLRQGLKARYIEDVSAHTWTIILRSHRLVDTLLATERWVREQLPPQALFQEQPNPNAHPRRLYSDRYYALWHEALRGMVERQMQAAIHEVASYWYTAWVNAGKPELRRRVRFLFFSIYR